jgi:hypothetical protein
VRRHGVARIAASAYRDSAVAQRWIAAVPAEAQWYAVPHTRSGRARTKTELDALPTGACVVLCDSWLLSRSRCRAIAARSAVSLTREYLALPTLARAVALVQDEPGTAKYLATSLLAPPPGSPIRSRAQGLLVPVVRLILKSRLRSVAFGGRVVLGARA